MSSYLRELGLNDRVESYQNNILGPPSISIIRYHNLAPSGTIPQNMVVHTQQYFVPQPYGGGVVHSPQIVYHQPVRSVPLHPHVVIGGYHSNLPPFGTPQYFFK